MANKDFIVKNGITLEGVGRVIDSAGNLSASAAASLNAIITSDTAPTSPEAGTLWWDSTTGTLKIYYNDSDGQQWLDAIPTIAGDFGTRNVNIIDTPTGLYDSDVNINTAFTLTASAYSDNLNQTHTSSDWQVSTDSAFGTTVLNVSADTTNLTSYTLDSGLDTPVTYYWRVRYRDNKGDVSNYSANKSFTVIVPPPTVLGQSYQGGFYIGTATSLDSTCYYLIVAPNATGCACCLWKTTTTASANVCSLNDGYANTYTGLNNGDHPAGNWTATRTIGGFSDWYLPSRDELNVLYVNDGGATNTNLPAGEGFAATGAGYWSSTENDNIYVCVQFFNNGNISRTGKTQRCRVRAVRREPI